jgi:hypothetical protein
MIYSLATVRDAVDPAARKATICTPIDAAV